MIARALVALAAALAAAHALLPPASAQPAGGEDAEVAEELRRIREQMGEANRASAALFWSSVLVGTTVALVAVAGTACSVVYLRRHFRLLDADARERLRPALARTECRVVETVGTEGGAGAKGSTRSRHVVLEVTNVGAVAAVGVSGSVRYGTGTKVASANNHPDMDLSFGALAPNYAEKIIMSIDAEENEDDGNETVSFWFEVAIEYMAIGGRTFGYRAAGKVRGRQVYISETVP